MGQQYSAVGENAVAAATAERKIRGENVEPGNGHLNPAWRKNVSAVVSSLPSHGELISGDSSSSHRSKTEGDASRMSIRAAIDSFIENCLSTPTEDTTADRSHTDSCFSGQNKQILGSLSPKIPNSSSEDDAAQSDGSSLEVKTNISLTDMKDGPNSDLINFKDGHYSNLKNLKAEPCSALADLTDRHNSTLKDLKDRPNSALSDLKDGPNSSLKDLKEESKDLKDEPNSTLMDLTDRTNSILTDLKDGPNSTLSDLKDGPKSPLKDLKAELESSPKDTKDTVSKPIDKEVFFNCVDKAPSKGTDNDLTGQLNDEPSDRLTGKTYVGTQQEGVKEGGNENTKNVQNDNVQDNSAEASNTSVEKQMQTSTRTEKQSFSAFLQDRLSRGDFDKREELAQLALSKDIKYQEQMIMWEAVRKPAALSESSGTSYELDGSLLTTGPVRLQTLIDRVLDSSLNNRNSAVTFGHSPGSQVASAASGIEKAGTQLNLPRTTPSDQCNRISPLEKNASPGNDNRLSFKNHIEKVLMESFLSYEEDERKETSKRESISIGPSMKTSSDSQTSVKECTISVQDLVDQVISQTEMSKLLTPSTRDTSRPASSCLQTNKDRSSLASGSESSVKHKAHRVSPQNTALIEAQRNMVQKELQSSTSLGRKRGRPQLNATGNSGSSATGLAKDPSQTPYIERIQEGKSSHSHTKMSPLNYASKGSLSYGISLNMSPLASHSAVAASATTVLQTSRHYIAQTPKEPPSSARTSLPSASVEYHLRPGESFQHQPEGQRESTQTYPNLSHSHARGFLSSSTAPPPLIIADQVSRSSQVLPVPHAPTKACACPVCLNHFSQGQNHTASPQLRVHHQFVTQDKEGSASIYPPSFQPHVNNFKDIYSHQASSGREPVLTAPVQGLSSVVIASQHNMCHSLPPSREVPSASQLDLHSVSAHHHHHQYPLPSQDRVIPPDSKFQDAHYQISKPRIQLDIHGSDFRKFPGNRNPHPGRVDDHKVEAAATVYTKPGKTFEQPLDLSVKPRVPSKPEKTACDPGTEVTKQDVWCHDRISPYRQSVVDKLPSDKAQSGVSKQGLPSGHHLQRLEKSVDRILPHGQSQLYDPQYIQQTHLPLHRMKMGSLPTPHETQGDGKHDLALSESRSLLLEPHDSRTSSHLSHSPIIYNQIVIDSPPQQQQQRQPTLAPPQNSRKLTPSPSTWANQVTSPQVNEHQFDPAGAASPAVQQRPSSLGLDPKQQVLVCSSAVFASVPTHPEKTPSPEEDDGHNFVISKHEPIQNIIGSHSPTDILYLICRLCRQTYGSPYGFRKHFRNQHGFEPKADHTIVQTISATKTAMAHTEHSHLLDETSLYPTYREEKLTDNSESSKSQSEATVSGPINNPEMPEDCKEHMKKEMDTKCLECPECGQTFQLNDFGSYKRHCRQHNLHRSYGPFACHDCRKSFAEPQQLREHLLTHSSVTSSLCGICHTFFSSPDHLAEHLQVAHGHTLGSEEGMKSSPHPYGPESNRLTDHTQTLQLGNQSSSPVNKSDFLSSQLDTVSASSTSASPSSTKFSSLQPPVQELKLSRSSASHCRPTSKHYHWNKPSPVDPHMFTVHTPKDLEVKKLPADGIVTTASPDSSYDDAKLHVDSQPASSTSQRSTVSTEAPTTNGNDTINSGTQELSNNSSHSGDKESASNSSHNGDKESASNSSDNDSKESTISFPPKKDESSNSFNSKSLTVKASNSSSSSELDEANSFYRHKKYGRHWKRHSVSDGDGEPGTKSPKLEGVSLVHRQSPFAVSSTINSAVTVHDCQSSSPSVEEPSPKLNLPNDDPGVNGFQSQFHEDQLHKLERKQKNDKAENSSEHKKDIVKVGGTSVRDFNWDRQTRSQAGKSSNMATRLP